MSSRLPTGTPPTDVASDELEPATAADAPQFARLGGQAGPTPRRTGLARGTVIMILLTSLASATNYASNLIFSRLLTPESYGDMTALLAFSVVAAVPTGAAQTVVAERIAAYLTIGDAQRARYLIRHAAAHIFTIAIIGGIVYAACIPLIERALDLQAIGPAIALLPLIVVSFFMPVAFGVLQGMERFIALGLVMLGIAASRIAFGVPWTVYGDGGAGGPLAGQAVGNALALVAVAVLIRAYLLRAGTGAATSGIKRRIDKRAVAASSTFIVFALISNLDVVLAKLFLPARDVGLYAALVTLEKIVIFLPGAVAIVMVPTAARARLTEGSTSRVLRIAALLVAATTLVAVIPAAAAPSFVIRNMFGTEYLGATDGVLPIVIAGAGLAVLYLLVVYTVAIEDGRWVFLLIGGVAAQVLGISAFHDSPAQVAVVQACVVGLVLVANEVMFHPLLRARRLARDPST